MAERWRKGSRQIAVVRLKETVLQQITQNVIVLLARRGGGGGGGGQAAFIFKTIYCLLMGKENQYSLRFSCVRPYG